MVVTKFLGKDFISTQRWSRDELDTVFDVAFDLKKKFARRETTDYLKGRGLFMIFYNSSLRTRNSFEMGMMQLGGFASYLTPEKMYKPTPEQGEKRLEMTEKISDSARVLSRYGDAIAIRIFNEPVDFVYGMGSRVIEEFARWADIPVINMMCDKYHPCQAMADMMTIKEKLGKVENKKFSMVWAPDFSPWRPTSVTNCSVLLTARYGMDVVLSHPKGFELDSSILEEVKKNAAEFGGSFKVTYDEKEAYEGADIVCAKSWTSLKCLPPATQKPDTPTMTRLLQENRGWTCTQEKLDLGNKNVKYMHPLPASRGYEVTDEVLDGPNSIVFDQAENRLHAQKAIMALIIGGRI